MSEQEIVFITAKCIEWYPRVQLRRMGDSIRYYIYPESDPQTPDDNYIGFVLQSCSVQLHLLLQQLGVQQVCGRMISLIDAQSIVELRISNSALCASDSD